jgi:hypothetical protein
MEQEIKNFIEPKRNPIKTNGKVSYWDGQRAWSIIRLKKEIINEFPQLKDRSSPVGYQLRFYREFEELEKALKRIKKESGVPPVLFWFFKDK